MAEVGQARLVQLGEGCAHLGHLHEGQGAFLHAGAAAAADDDEGAVLLQGPLGTQAQLLPHHAAHAGCEEVEVHDGGHHRMPRHGAFHDDHAILCLARLDQLLELVFVTLHGHEPKGVSALQIPEQGRPATVHEVLEALFHPDAEVVATFGADVVRVDQLFAVDQFLAGLALDPETLRHADGLFLDGDFLLTLLDEPGRHGGS